MSLVPYFPTSYTFGYTNKHELDLSWLVNDNVQLQKQIEQFVALNTVKYADPIDWNITSQYPTNCVVFNPADMTAYISTQPVPSGVEISNTDYWQPIFTLADIFTAYKTSITPIVQENAKPATQAIKRDDLLWIDNVLYVAVRDIAKGTTVVAGENVVTTSVSAELQQFISSLADEQTAREQADQQLQKDIAAEQTARQQADQQFQKDLTAEQSARQQAVQKLQEDLTAEQSARQQADRELDNKINNKGKDYYIFQGDSYGAGGGDWPTRLATMLGLTKNDTYYDFCHGGDGFSTELPTNNHAANTLRTYASRVDNPDKITKIIICMGRNDMSTASLNSPASITAGFNNWLQTLRELFKNATAYVGFIAWDLNVTEVTVDKFIGLVQAFNVYLGCCRNNSIQYLTGVQYAMHNREFFQDDGKHPNAKGSQAIAWAIYNAISLGSANVSYSYHAIDTAPAGIGKNPIHIGEQLENGIVNLWIAQDSGSDLACTPTEITANGTNRYLIGKADLNYVMGSGYRLTSALQMTVMRTTDNKYYLVPVIYSLYSGELAIYPLALTSENSNFLNITINNIRLLGSPQFTFGTMT